MVLKTYLIDWLENDDLYKRKLDRKNAEKVCKKLKRHFKLNFSTEFSKRGDAGTARYYHNSIQLNGTGTISLGVINHEVAHHLAFKKGSKKHNKVFRKCLKKCAKYIRKKNYWEGKIAFSIKEKNKEGKI